MTMRTLGALLLLVGIVGFFYCSSHLSGLESIPEGTSLGNYLQYDAGKFELGRYLALIAGFIGILLSLFPKGR
jgi:hypothetical protein